ncbi:protein phosphatase 1F isoform X3 [Carettochelys insculpta]|uniref:protein phosphatase 1F isoform X3 n=1 Tax=Carettochelys insculpta TaxID=44489 RepID=UPI003EBB9198
MALPSEAARGVLGSLLRDYPALLGPEDPLPWSAQGSATLSRAEAPGELAELGRSFLGGRDVPPLLAASLVHAAIDEVLQTDLAAFKKQSVEEEEEGHQGKFTLLDGGSLQRCFFNKLQDICCEWQKQLPSLKSLKRFLLISSHAIRNVRRKMEDRHVSLPEFNQLFGFLKLRSGTTGVSALIVGNRLHIAWVGDSQVMLVQHGKAVTLMEPHKPEREDERERIEALGGCVTYMDCWRVNGTLAVSRAIGDVYQKPYISGNPDGNSFELTGSEDYLLLACDGFFDAIRRDDVMNLVLDHLMQNKGDGVKAAERLVAAAKENGSSDNITVLVVFLRDPKDILADCLGDPKSLSADEGAAESPSNFFSSAMNSQSDSRTTTKS